jgi:hypothetical protein
MPASGIMTAPAHASVSGFDWVPTDGETLRFDVFRKGKPFGYHTVSFDIKDKELHVKNDIKLEVKIGPFQAFYYKHDSDEIWTDGELLKLKGETTKEGDDFYVQAKQEADELDVVGTSFTGVLPETIIPSSHWNIREVMSTEILSSEGGEPLPVTVEKIGRETISAGGRQIEADRYRLKSDLTVDLWYDASGKWVKCQFEARGQKIEYVLKA